MAGDDAGRLMDAAQLERLCLLYGIDTEFTDIWGKRHAVADDDLRLLLAAMGVDGHDDAALATTLAQREALIWTRSLAPVRVVRNAEGTPHIRFTLPVTHADETLQWRLELADSTGRCNKLAKPLSRCFVV